MISSASSIKSVSSLSGSHDDDGVVTLNYIKHAFSRSPSSAITAADVAVVSGSIDAVRVEGSLLEKVKTDDGLYSWELRSAVLDGGVESLVLDCDDGRILLADILSVNPWGGESNARRFDLLIRGGK